MSTVHRSDWIKKRCLPLVDGVDPVDTLLQLEGVISAEIDHSNQLILCYDLRKTDLESLLNQPVLMNATELEIKEINSYYEDESSQKSELAAPAAGWQACVQNVYVNDYLLRLDSKKQKRPHHWQQYLDKKR